MCSLAPPPTALGLGFPAAAAPRRRGVAPPACGATAREPVRRAGAAASSAAPAQKRSREAPGQQQQQQRRLQERMREELDAIRDLHRKAVLLASKSKASPLKKRAPEAAQQSTEPVKKKQRQQQQQQKQSPVVDQRATPAPTKLSTAEALEKAREILERRRLEEMARAREKFRQEVLEMTPLPDETIYPRDLQELGIAFEYAVTRTWRQAHG
ncbi:unnamed protein product [Urochloa humidicola]